MRGKYTNPLTYNVVRLQRFALRMVLRRLVRWEPMRDPQEGYTILLGCNSQLASMLGATLRMLAAQDLTHLDRVIVVMDRPSHALTFPVEAEMRQRFPTLPLHFIYYTKAQARILGAISWGWAYAWLSWSLALAETRTRYAMVQDFDAMLLRSGIVEERYRAIVERGDEYLGDRWYVGGGVEAADGLVITPELFFDASFVRRHHRPIELFNHVMTHRDRTVDFDTFLFAQATRGRRSVMAIREEEVVHPSQMICQFTHLTSRGTMLRPHSNNLLLIPYFIYVGGDEGCLLEHTQKIAASTDGNFVFFGKTVRLDGMAAAHIAWLRKQAYRLEEALAGGVRPAVREYFDRIDALHARYVNTAPALTAERLAHKSVGEKALT